MMKHVLDPVPSLRDFDPAQLPAADQIAAQAMAKDREKPLRARPSSVKRLDP